MTCWDVIVSLGQKEEALEDGWYLDSFAAVIAVAIILILGLEANVFL